MHLKVSASQLKMFQTCHRSWYLKYVEKIEVPVKPALRIGIEFHNYIETIYKKNLGIITENVNVSPDIKLLVDNSFENGLLYYPKKYLIEHAINFEVNDSVKFTGKIDLIDIPANKIIDHKTIKDIKYGLSENDLKNDLQLNAYGFWYLKRLPKVKQLSFRHNQLNKTSPAKSTKVEVTVSRESVESYWKNDILPIIGKLEGLKKINNKEAFKCNLNSCENYGGCDYKRWCHG